MNQKLKDYLINTLLVQVFTIIVLTPWLIFMVGLTFDQWVTWLWQSSLIAFVYGHALVLWIRFWRRKMKKLEVKPFIDDKYSKV